MGHSTPPPESSTIRERLRSKGDVVPWERETVKHAGWDALGRLESLLGALRECSELKERSRGVFYWKSKPFLHFHEDVGGLYADVRTGPEFARFPVNSELEKGALMEEVRAALSSAPRSGPTG
ncbi:hypothetical protein WJ542_27755 [Paraburkholderia sp. B3]|uniref:hypothetical protein n=1 Tax=Paraburkholderia sp. B3 TaxID=3134791 RepID=UPI003981B2E1